MKSICVIVNKYPNKVDPTGLVFVQQLVWSLKDLEVDCKVICPLAINLYPKYLKIPSKITEVTSSGKKVDVYFPKYFGLGQSHHILGKSPASLTTSLFTRTVMHTIRKFDNVPDVFYGHFVTPAGIAAARAGRKFKKPSYLAYGESTSWSIDQFGYEAVRNELSSLAGVIAVSTRNKELLLSLKAVSEEKVKVFPNGYRSERFYRRDKQISREKMGFAQNAFIVGFCGSFDDRKGILRLEKAVEQIDNAYMVAAGKGKLRLSSSKCLFAEPVNNEKLPYFYSSLDAFVLPTKNEGCCNAIIEAMACGCPIISSDKSFNYDILDSSNAILINPEDVDDIVMAIRKIMVDVELRINMSESSLQKAKNLTLEKRAEAIKKYIFE